MSDDKKSKKNWHDDQKSFSPEEQKIGDIVATSMPSAFAKWKKGKDEKKKKKMLQLAGDMEQGLTAFGGFSGYAKHIKKICKEAASEKYNPYHGLVASAPTGQIFTDSKEDMKKIEEMEAKGLEAVGNVAFVLCAGGAGSRLGHKGAKMALTADVSRDEPVLKHFVDHILAFQESTRSAATDRRRHVLPLVIMTSDDTDEAIRTLLEENNNFGMASNQITIIKQAKVCVVKDLEAHFQTLKDPYHWEMANHGTGAVHSLLAAQGLVEQWAKKGFSHIMFFHDNNLLSFHGVLAALGVSITEEYHVNHIAVERSHNDKTMDPIITWTKKKSDPPQQHTAVMSSLLTDGQDDVWKNAKIKDNADGPSKFPAATHTMLVEMKAYQAALEDSKGVVQEFIYPKWKDRKKGTLKSNVGLQCHFDNLSVANEAKVGYTQLPTWMVWAPFVHGFDEAKLVAKNGGTVQSMTTAEHSLYYYYRKVLSAAVESLDVEGKAENFGGMKAPNVGIRVVLSPSFGQTMEMLRGKFQNDIKISTTSSTLVLDGPNITVDGLDLKGALCVRAPHARVTIDNLNVKNDGWALVKIPEKRRKKAKKDTKFMIRGYHSTRDPEKALIAIYSHAGVFDLFNQAQTGNPVVDANAKEETAEKEKEAASTPSRTPNRSPRKTNN